MVRAEGTRAMHHHICTAVRAYTARRTIFYAKVEELFI